MHINIIALILGFVFFGIGVWKYSEIPINKPKFRIGILGFLMLAVILNIMAAMQDDRNRIAAIILLIVFCEISIFSGKEEDL